MAWQPLQPRVPDPQTAEPLAGCPVASDEPLLWQYTDEQVLVPVAYEAAGPARMPDLSRNTSWKVPVPCLFPLWHWLQA